MAVDPSMGVFGSAAKAFPLKPIALARLWTWSDCHNGNNFG
jgi:hypothetical protein